MTPFQKAGNLTAFTAAFLVLHLPLNAQVKFREMAAEYDIGYSYGGTSVGGGISFCDFNGDGYDDLSIATNEGDSLLFYTSNGCSLTRIASLAGNTDEVKQLTWVDFDNDGDKDLFLTTMFDGLVLYEQSGPLQFTDITLSAGIDTFRMLAHSANWADYDRDGDLDVYIGTWIAMDTISDILYRNNGNKTFTDVTRQAGLWDTNSICYASVFFDYNKDGWPDLYATTDKINYPNKLYRNNMNGTFTDVSVASGTFFYIDAMSGTADDYNNDGWTDLYVTNTYAGNLLLHNNGNGTFTDTAAASGVDMNSWTWGAVFADGENDGDLDLYVSSQENGTTYPSSAYFVNNGLGQFTSPPIQGMAGDTARSYGNATGDYNDDGLPDFAVNNRDEAAFVWRNESQSGNFIKVLLEGTLSNRDAVGSFIYLYHSGKMQMRYTICGESFLGQNSTSEIFGISAAASADSLSVVWPGGLKSSLHGIPANSTVKIIEGQAGPALSLAVIGSAHPCDGDSVELRALHVFDHYSWNTGDTTPSIYADSSGTYILTANNTSGPSRVISAGIDFTSMPSIDLGNDTFLCQGQSLTLNSTHTGGCTFWSDGSSGQDFETDSGGLFWAEAVNGSCKFRDSIEVVYFEAGQIDLGNDTIICAGDTLVLDAGAGWTKYSWSDNSQGRRLTVSQSGIYIVEVTDSNGCTASDEVEVYVTICGGIEEEFYNTGLVLYPNPSNDEVVIRCSRDMEFIQSIAIYNIHGALAGTYESQEKEFRICTEDFTEGSYIISIGTNSGQYRSIMMVRH